MTEMIALQMWCANSFFHTEHGRFAGAFRKRTGRN
jgi:hypothetical protein